MAESGLASTPVCSLTLASVQIPAERDKITFSKIKWQLSVQLRRNLRQLEGAKLLEQGVEPEKQARELLWILSLRHALKR